MTRIGIVLSISLAFFLAEIAGKPSLLQTLGVQLTLYIPVGFRTKSLALIADAVGALFSFPHNPSHPRLRHFYSSITST